MNKLEKTRTQEGPEKNQEKTAGESVSCGSDRPTIDKATSLKMDALLADIRNLLTQVS